MGFIFVSALAFQKIISPLSFIFGPWFIIHYATPCFCSIGPLSFVSSILRVLYSIFSRLDSLHKWADVYSFILFQHQLYFFIIKLFNLLILLFIFLPLLFHLLFPFLFFLFLHLHNMFYLSCLCFLFYSFLAIRLFLIYLSFLFHFFLWVYYFLRTACLTFYFLLASYHTRLLFLYFLLLFYNELNSLSIFFIIQPLPLIMGILS
jgi:hypothetical protein